MSYAYRFRSGGSSFSSGFPPAVKWLLIVNIALFVLMFALTRMGAGGIFFPFGLVPEMVVESFAVWQLVTYLFLHSPGDPAHLLLNMLALWMFGAQLERTWGTRAFLRFYFICGIGAGICAVLGNYLYGTPGSWTIGASGAIYGVLVAFAVLFPETIIIFIIFPIKAKYFAMIVGALAFFGSISGGGGISHVAHLGGLIVGYLYVRSRVRTKVNLMAPVSAAQSWYQRWKMERARRRFQVYLRKRDSQDPRVH